MLDYYYIKIKNKETLIKLSPFIKKLCPADIAPVNHKPLMEFKHYPLRILFEGKGYWGYNNEFLEDGYTEIPIEVILEPENYPEYYL